MSRRIVRLAARFCAASAIVALAACGSLPLITPDLAPANPGAVQFQAASGRIVSPERSRDILARLSSGEESDVLGRHLALEQAVSGSPLSLGNHVVLLENGPDTYAAMLSAIADAHDRIDMETYILEDDEAGQRFADALIDKQRQGVQVNLIRDSVGTLHTPKAFFERLTDAGIQVVEFNPVNPLTAKAGWDVNQRDHRKLLIVDGRIGVLGGINISSVYSGGSSSSGRLSGSGAKKARSTCPGATPTCRSKGQSSRSCRSSSWKRGTARRGQRWRRARTSRRSRPSARRWFAPSAARPTSPTARSTSP
jgi:cardiolipin synthase